MPNHSVEVCWYFYSIVRERYNQYKRGFGECPEDILFYPMRKLGFSASGPSTRSGNVMALGTATSADRHSHIVLVFRIKVHCHSGEYPLRNQHCLAGMNTSGNAGGHTHNRTELQTTELQTSSSTKPTTATVAVVMVSMPSWLGCRGESTRTHAHTHEAKL